VTRKAFTRPVGWNSKGKSINDYLYAAILAVGTNMPLSGFIVKSDSYFMMGDNRGDILNWIRRERIGMPVS
jgi:hypothetical protein